MRAEGEENPGPLINAIAEHSWSLYYALRAKGHLTAKAVLILNLALRVISLLRSK